MPSRDRRDRVRRSPLDVATEKLAFEAKRTKAVADYENGRPVKDIAYECGVKPRTVIDWVKARRRLVHRPNRRIIERSENYAGLSEGAGGRMRDIEVRGATLKLEEKIVALMALDGFAPLDYRRAEV